MLNATCKLRLGKQRADTLGAGGRHAGQGDRQIRVTRQQLAHQWRRRNAFANRDGMHPDAAGTQWRQANREPFADPSRIRRRAPGTPHQAQGDKRQAEVKQQGIERSVHGGEA